MKRCKFCMGGGRLHTECCSGAGGCTCRGEIVDLGPCRACDGRGEYEKEPEGSPNLDYIRSLGRLHFLGSGPDSMRDTWPNRGNLL